MFVCLLACFYLLARIGLLKYFPPLEYIGLGLVVLCFPLFNITMLNKKVKHHFLFVIWYVVRDVIIFLVNTNGITLHFLKGSLVIHLRFMTLPTSIPAQRPAAGLVSEFQTVLFWKSDNI